jgi:hypothetical protein
MNPLLLVFILIVAAAAIMVCVAVYLGWFNLQASAAHDKVQFILMRKKVDEVKAPVTGKDPQRPAPNKIGPHDRPE